MVRDTLLGFPARTLPTIVENLPPAAVDQALFLSARISSLRFG